MARIVPATAEWMIRAANVIREGGIVAFPTETVYGLGANALDASAVRMIFDSKGRPATNPLIVHIADVSQLQDVAAGMPQYATALIEAFWPGPLTLVFSRSFLVPDIVTASASTVAVRMPAHPIALELLRLVAAPLAAPSANRSEQVSPTTALHVAESLGDAVDLILDGGPCQVGIESTVLNLTTNPPTILRPGAIGARQIADVIGIRPTRFESSDTISPALSPGQMRRHYAPRTPLHLTNNIGNDVSSSQAKIGIVIYDADITIPKPVLRRVLPPDPTGYSRLLYATLHDLDDQKLDLILVQAVPQTDEWLPVQDRLARASGPKPI